MVSIIKYIHCFGVELGRFLELSRRLPYESVLGLGSYVVIGSNPTMVFMHDQL